MVKPGETPIWQPSKQAIEDSNLKAFMDHVKAYHGLSLNNFDALYEWSLAEPEQFWQCVWHFTGLLSHKQGDIVLENAKDMENARFFPAAQLNYAENVLRRRDQGVAIEFFGEDKVHTILTYEELYRKVCKFSKVLKEWGVRPGDRVVGYIPNLPEAVVAMLATTSIGAVWAACSPDYGFAGVVSRLGQLHPKVLLIAEGYYYEGKYFDCLARIDPIRRAIPSIEHTVLIGYHGASPYKKGTENWDLLLQSTPLEDLIFTPWPFLHPLLILFLSATTGAPRGMIHSAGGTLLQHLKEHRLHYDLKPDDRVFCYTSCEWGIWNCLVSALASQASVVLYDGSPFYPRPQRLFDIVEQTSVKILGSHSTYFEKVAQIGIKPIQTHNLSSLRMIVSSGPSLKPECFDYIYKNVKKDVCLSPILWGANINSCFILGNPIGDVWRGEMQTAGLGTSLEVFDEQGNSLSKGQGELVCTAPFPSQPLGIWNDPGGEKYHQTYFAHYKNVWRNGNFVEKMAHGGFTIHGRSDNMLSSKGRLIGTAEIYGLVSQIDEVLESMVVGQRWQGDTRIILFVKLRPSLSLVDDLVEKIKHYILQNMTLHYVPEVILQVSHIPRMKNKTLAELAVTDIVNARTVKNKLDLANPISLKEYEHLTKEFLTA